MAQAETEKLTQIICGAALSRAVCTIAERGIADQIESRPPRAAESLAGATGTHERSLYRILRLLARIALVLRPLIKYLRSVLAQFLALAALHSAAFATDILTSRGDLARTGLNPNESILTPVSVNPLSFGVVYNQSVDGQVYAQPLYVSNQQIKPPGGQRNVLYVATEHDSLYAFDADTGVLYWKRSLLPTGESPVQANDPNINCPNIEPEMGVTATPVIDKSNNTIFVVAFSKDSNGNYYNRLHAIDLSTGQDRIGIGPVIISASTPGTGPANTFNPTKERGRAGLLLPNPGPNGIIYTSWGSYCDNLPWTGFLIAFHESDLSPAGVLNTDPNGLPLSNGLPASGNGIWQNGTAPAVDSNGNIYVLTGNGPFDPTNQDYGDSVLKLLTPGPSVSDYFAPYDQATDATTDNDLGSGAAVVLPDITDTNGTHHHLLVAAGKDGRLYLLDRDNLGKFNPGGPDLIYQELPAALGGECFSSAAYFNGSVYLGSSGSPIYQFQFDYTNPVKPLLHSVSSTSTTFSYPGATATISSNGTSAGIVWAIQGGSARAILHAYDATNLAMELYNSSTVNNSGSIHIGGAVTFSVPTVCNGKVFIGTSNSIAAFGLLKRSKK